MFLFSYLNDSSTQTEEPGGSFTMGVVSKLTLYLFPLTISLLRFRE